MTHEQPTQEQPTPRSTSSAVELVRRITDPASTAVLTVELQNGVVGSSALLPALADAVRRSGSLAAAARVCSMARAVGIRVVHCTVEDRPDLAGFAENCRLLAVAAKRRRRDGHGPTDAGTVGALVVPELGADARDLVVPRLSGISAFTPSALDQVLRNLGVSTVVVVGVSVNLAIFGTAMSAVDLGYQVVLVRDAVVGIPADYADAVIDHSLSLIATVVSSDELEQVWSPVG